MKRGAALTWLCILVAGLLCASSHLAAQPPVGHPQLPAGHPRPDQPTRPVANPADVESVETILAAYYEAISGEAGQPRDWNRFRSLFSDDGKLVTVKEIGGQTASVSLTPEQFIDMSRKYFERTGYSERPLYIEIDRFGNMAHVLSTYESCFADRDEPHARGIYSMQLIGSGQRWWITAVLWEVEREDNPIPAAYLPPAESGE